MSAEHRGKLIIFEGIDGSGKTSQIAPLAEFLEERGRSIILTREPGGGNPKFREEIFALDRDAPGLADRELTLFENDRSLHYQNTIIPALKAGQIVICDRGPTSTLAYQGYGRGMGLERIRIANRQATFETTADLTLLFDLDPEIARERLAARNGESTRFDAEPMSFHQALRNGFLAEAALDPHRWFVIDASGTQEEVSAQVKRVVREMLGL